MFVDNIQRFSNHIFLFALYETFHVAFDFMFHL